MSAVGRHRLVRESFWVAIAQGGAIVARLAGVKVLTTILPPGAYGEATLLVGVAAFGTNVFCLPVLQAALRFHPEAVAAGRLGAFRSSIGRILATALGALIVLLMSAAVFARDDGLSPAAAACVAGLLVADTARLFESGLINAARRQRTYALWTLLDALARPAGAAAAALVLARTGSSVVLGTLVGCVVAMLPFLPKRERGMGPADAAGDAEWIRTSARDIRRFIAPLVPFALLGWIIGIGDRYVIAALAGTAPAGLYGAAYGIASQPFMAASTLGVTVVRPVLFQFATTGADAAAARVVRVWILLTLGLGAIGVAFVALEPGTIVHLLMGPQFAPAAPLLVWIAAAYALQGLQYVFETVLYAQRATGRLMIVQGVGAAVAIALYATLIPRHGAMGAAWATLGSFIASSLASFALAGGLPVLLGRNARIR